VEKKGEDWLFSSLPFDHGSPQQNHTIVELRILWQGRIEMK
jgi:hypothetical protein